MLQLTENKQHGPVPIENFEPTACARKAAQEAGTRPPAGMPLGLWPGLEGHGYEGAHEDGGEKLADDRLCDGERARERKYGDDVAADRGQRSKTVVGELRGELVQIGGRGKEAEGAGMKLFNKLI